VEFPPDEKKLEQYFKDPLLPEKINPALTKSTAGFSEGVAIILS